MSARDLEAIKQHLLDARTRIVATREALKPDHPYGERGQPNSPIIQALYDVEYSIDMALHEIDPNLVS
jgi:hypothetical protein